MSELLKKVDSRYLLVNVVAHRARTIAAEADKKGDVLEKKPVSLAIDEIAAGSYSARIKNRF
jgi:DNA-directed RNA polymerase subunit omega